MSVRAWLPEDVKAPLRRLRTGVRDALHPWIRAPLRKADNPFATHIPILLAIASIRGIRRVLELGSGENSTLTFLNPLAFPTLEYLESVENDADWAARVHSLIAHDRRATLKIVDGAVADYVKFRDLMEFDLILIDDSSETDARSATIREIAGRVAPHQIVVIHDFECADYQRAAQSAPNVISFSAFLPHTGVLFQHDPPLREALHGAHEIIDAWSRRISITDNSTWLKALRGGN